MKTLIVGGTKGFGKAVVRSLLKKGDEIIVVGRTPSPFRNHESYIADVRDLDGWRQTLKTIARAHSRIDRVVFITGYAMLKPVEENTPQDWKKHLSANLTYVALALGILRDTFGNGAQVVTIGSQWSYKTGNPYLVPYTIAKHALRVLTSDFASRNPRLVANHYCVPAMNTPRRAQMHRTVHGGKLLPHTETNPVLIAERLVSHFTKHEKSGRTLVINSKGAVREI